MFSRVSMKCRKPLSQVQKCISSAIELVILFAKFRKLLKENNEAATHTKESQWEIISIEIVSLKINSHAGSMSPPIE
jgi:hypothetical protein